MAKTSNPAGLSHEQIIALRDQSKAPGKAPIEQQQQQGSQWAKAPDISQKAPKVSKPSVSDGSGNQVSDSQAAPITGPSPEFQRKQAAIRAAELAARDEAIQARQQEAKELAPQALLSRISYLERQVKKLERSLKKEQQT